MDGLDTSFLATADAPADTAAAEVSETPSTPTESIEVTTEAAQETTSEAAETVQEPAEGEAPEAPVAGEEGSEATEDEEYSEEELLKMADDPKTPKWFRDQIKKATGYSRKLKEQLTEQTQQFESLRQEAETGRIPDSDLERLRAAEERQYKLSSFNTEPQEIISSLTEIIPRQKLEEVKSALTWSYLEDQNGQPNLENLQVIVDRLSGDTKVQAKDVIDAIEALKRGTIDPAQFQEFATEEEYESYRKIQEMNEQIAARESQAKANAEFQEAKTRTGLLTDVSRGIQSQFQPQVEGLLQKFNLMPTAGEPKVAADLKARIQERLARTISEAQETNPNLVDLWKGMKMLQQPTGATPESIQDEINRFTNSFPYQTALSRGISELMSVVEKAVAEEAYHYSLAMEGYQARASKGQTAREVIGQPNQTDVSTNFTQAELAKMSSAQRRDATLKQISQQLREQKFGVTRFG